MRLDVHFKTGISLFSLEIVCSMRMLNKWIISSLLLFGLFGLAQATKLSSLLNEVSLNDYAAVEYYLQSYGNAQIDYTDLIGML